LLELLSLLKLQGVLVLLLFVVQSMVDIVVDEVVATLEIVLILRVLALVEIVLFDEHRLPVLVLRIIFFVVHRG
jgi:hypothetical protein